MNHGIDADFMKSAARAVACFFKPLDDAITQSSLAQEQTALEVWESDCRFERTFYVLHAMTAIRGMW
jgi:hypothetical protein